MLTKPVAPITGSSVAPLSSNKQRSMMGGGGANTGPKRAWKLQESAAHQASVNCLTLGHKSGRVMATGGDDKRVNLWAIGKTGCIMSLTGHVTPVECVRFGQTEELICAGSLSGAIKLWDLEAAKLIRTLAGHKAIVKCLDFHPYGNFVASGSQDATIKIWDVRRRGCIFTYKGHERAVNSLQFSPDGQWVASGSDDNTVRLWDLRAGKQLTSFQGHTSGVKAVMFHPQEFLLASGGVDRRVLFWDLECLQKASAAGGSADQGSGAIRCLTFNPAGDCLFAGVQDALKMYGWEPGRTLDTVVLNWGKVADIAVAQNQLIGASFQNNEVAVFVVDLKRVGSDCPPVLTPEPTTPTSVPCVVSNTTSLASKVTAKSSMSLFGNFKKGQSPPRPIHHRKNFDREKSPHSKDLKTEEPDTDPGPSTDGEEDAPAHILNQLQYSQIFQPRGRQLARTPPPQAQPFPAPPADEEDSDDALTTPGGFRGFAQVPPIPSRPARHRNSLPSFSSHHSTVTTASMTTSSPSAAGLSRRRESLSGGSSTSSSSSTSTSSFPRHPVLSGIKTGRSLSESRRCAAGGSGLHLMSASTVEIPSKDSDLRLSSNHSPSPLFPSFPSPLVHSASYSLLQQSVHRGGIPSSGAGAPSAFTPVEDILPSEPLLDPVNFLPRAPCRSTSFSGAPTVVDMSESEVISQLINGHQSMLKLLSIRLKAAQILQSYWHKRDPRTAVEYAIDVADRGDVTTLVDFLGVLVVQESAWNLDICLLLLPRLQQLIQSPFETYVSQGAKGLKVILRNFAPVIRSNMTGPVNVGVGVDISREERRRKSRTCYETLVSIRAFILKRQTLQGTLGHTFRELATLIQNLD